MKRGTSAPSRLGLFHGNHSVWPTAHTRRLPSFSRPPNVAGGFFLAAKVGHSFLASLPCPGPILHFSSALSVLQAIFVLDKKIQICGRVTLRVTLRILQQRCMSLVCQKQRIYIVPACEWRVWAIEVWIRIEAAENSSWEQKKVGANREETIGS